MIMMVMNDVVVRVCLSGMLTRPEVDEAKAKAEANSHEAEANSDEAEAKIALFFFSQILHFDSIFSKTDSNFRSIFDGTSKISAQKTGFNMGTLLEDTPKTTSYAFGRRLPLLCLHTE